MEYLLKKCAFKKNTNKDLLPTKTNKNWFCENLFCSEYEHCQISVKNNIETILNYNTIIELYLFELINYFRTYVPMFKIDNLTKEILIKAIQSENIEDFLNCFWKSRQSFDRHRFIFIYQKLKEFKKIKWMTEFYNSSLNPIKDTENEAKNNEIKQLENDQLIEQIFRNLEDVVYPLDLNSIPENKEDECINWWVKIIRTEEKNKFEQYDWLFADAT